MKFNGLARILRVALPALFILMLGRCVSAQTLSSFQCDPTSCQEYDGPTLNGSVSLEASGVCTDGNPVSRFLVATATNCTEPVLLEATGEETSRVQLDDEGCPYEIDGVRVDAYIYANGEVVWHAYGQSDCDGGITGDTQGTAPC